MAWFCGKKSYSMDRLGCECAVRSRMRSLVTGLCLPSSFLAQTELGRQEIAQLQPLVLVPLATKVLQTGLGLRTGG